MSLAFLCIPAFLYLLFVWYRRVSRPMREEFAPAVIAGLALISTLVLLSMMNHPGPWTDRTQIAWVGIEAADNQPLVMGGNLLDAAPAWPLRYAAPRVSFAAAGGDKFLLNCSGGGGFVVGSDNQVLYGTPLDGGDLPTAVGDYKLAVRSYWFAIPWTHARHVIRLPDVHLWLLHIDLNQWHIFIFDKKGNSLLSGNEGIVRASDETVLNLPGPLDGAIRRMRAHSDPASGPLIEWASHISLLLAPGGKAYFVADSSDLQPAAPGFTIAAGSEITIHWPRLRLPMRVESDAGAPRLIFAPPFRQSSPLPPPVGFANPDQVRLAIEASPSPGDVAYLLPISLLHQRRFDAVLKQGLFTQPSAPSKIAVTLPDAGRPSYEDFPGVTSSLDAAIDRYHFYIDTIRDVPAVWFPGKEGSGLPLSVPLVLAWMSYLCCIAAVAGAKTFLEPRTRLSLLGISLVVWIALCLRVGLAYRYAANPGTLDDLARRGILLALVAITVVPGFLLLFACLMVVARAGSETAAILRKMWLWTLPTFLILFSLPFLVARIWPLLNRSALSVDLASSLPLLLLWAWLSLSLWRKARRLERHSWKPPVPAEDRLASIQQWVERRWEAGWPAKNVLLMIGISAAVSVLAVATNFVRPLNGVGKEVLTPLYQLMAMAMVLAAKPYSLRGERRIPSWRRWGLRLTLIFVPFFVLPPCFGDIGGIYAGLSLLVPFGFVLMFRQVRRPVWFLAPLGSLLVIAFFLLWYFPGQVPGQRSYARLQLWQHTSQWVQSHVLWEQAYSPDSRWQHVEGWFFTHLLGQESWSPGGTSRAQQLADADAHIWANRRMVAIGGFFGQGYGQVRASKAGIPLQTLQSDSTYAFYIAGEHGAVGGTFLLLFASLPLGFVWWRYRQSHGPTWLSDLLYIIGAAFYVETLCHIVMNALPLIPITGRSMPFLSVHSLSDVLRWTALFACAALLMVTDRESAVAGRDNSSQRRWHSVLILFLVLSFAALPSLALMDPAPAIYDRDQRIRDQIDATRDRLIYRADARVIAFQNPKIAELEEYNEIHQEMEHFNRLPDEQKAPLHGPRLPGACGELGSAATPEEYGDWMEEQMKCDAPSRAPHPPLFRVFAPDDYADAEDVIENTDRRYVISANPAFDAAVNLDTELHPGDLKTIAWRDGSGESWLLEGMGLQIRIAGLATSAQLQSRVVLRQSAGRFIPSAENTSGNTRLLLACGDAGAPRKGGSRRGQGARAAPLMDVFANEAGIRISPVDMKLDYESGPGGSYKKLSGPTQMVGDVRIRTHDGVCGLREHPSFALVRSTAGALVGEAWVEGEWVPAYNKDAGIPWLEQLAWAMHSKHPPDFSRLTLDPKLESAAQQFVEERGRDLEKKLLAEHPGSLPPRVALSIMTAPSGEVVALGGWPRSSSTEEWEPVPDEDGQHWIDVRPPVRWLATRAPAAIRSRYLGERNFDLMIVGSASKPMWAAAALAVNPRLLGLEVTGQKTEDSLFGTQIPGKAWTGTPSGWTTFPDYLALSNNSYQVVLNFLALAKPADGANPVEVEKDGGGRDVQTGSRSVAFGSTVWNRFPDLSSYGFSTSTPNALHDVQTSSLATTLQTYFPLEATSGALRLHRISFWSSDERDNRALPEGTTAEDDPWNPYVYISPATTDLALDEVERPRLFISDLLGGGTNLWSNIDLPSGVYTALFGTRLVPHIGVMSKPPITTRTGPGPEVTSHIQEGLKRMIDHGTGRDYLPGPVKKFAEDTHCGCDFYAKTGTLEQEANIEDMARIVLVIVPHDSRPGGARKTLILSLMVEHGGKEVGRESNNAVQWIADFLTQNESMLQNAMR